MSTCASPARRVRPGALRRGLVCLLFALAVAQPTAAIEEQAHGLAFETWVRDTFFDGYAPPGYTQKWDIPAEQNRHHGAIPVNPKAAKYGGPVDLGDALRQFDINEPFLLVIGYWEQAGPTKRVVHILAARVEPATWRRLWGDLRREHLERLDALIKDRTQTPEAVRRAAQALKRTAPYDSSRLVLNPKIDAHGQRRLQCSLRFDDVFRHLAPNTAPDHQTPPTLWGVAFTEAIASAPRGTARAP